MSGSWRCPRETRTPHLGCGEQVAFLAQRVALLRTDGNLTRGAVAGLTFLVHEASLGRRDSMATLAQWLGTRLICQEGGGTRFDSRLV